MFYLVMITSSSRRDAMLYKSLLARHHQWSLGWCPVKMTALVFCFVLFGWATTVMGSPVEDQDLQESSWASYGWAESWSKTHTPEKRSSQDQRHDHPRVNHRRRRQQPLLLYAVWEEPPLLVKEAITSEEAAWVPEEAPLETIKESYAFGSRQFDHNFGRSPAFIVETVDVYDAPAQPRPDTPHLPPPSLDTPHPPPSHPPPLDTQTLRTPYQAPQYPVHQPRHDPRPIPYHGRPRKYYLTGVMEELPRDTSHVHRHFRKYSLHSGTGDAEDEGFHNEIEDPVYKVDVQDASSPPTGFTDIEAGLPSAPKPPPHSLPGTSENLHNTPTSQDNPKTTYYSPYYPPGGLIHRPFYPPPPARTHYLHRPPPPQYPRPHYPTTSAPFRKYYLRNNSATHDDGTQDALEEEEEEEALTSLDLSSFEVYELVSLL
ncbi:putative splicing factor 3A subunit 2-like 4 [Homarus americanus]|uniref:Putative splicing factor 3A subunit 2-like 4 n=1 Tax=Homarus americanus TaxID=6706 RepID=A0A8J5K4F0_HOMAM|nr:putative splicing factor 3A subunit 2-like 4 [Homarus americanus]